MKRVVLVLTLLPVATTSACSLIFESGAGSGAIDANQGDADPNCELATIVGGLDLPDLECGETEVVVPKIETSAGPSICPVTELAWQLSRRSPDGTFTEVLFSEQGAPGDPMPAQARILGGSFEEPIFNVAQYHGKTLARVEVTTSGTIFDQFYQDIGAIGTNDYRLRLALASNQRQSVKVRLFPVGSANGNPALGLDSECFVQAAAGCESPTELTTFIKDFTVTGATTEDARLRFALDKGIYFFDAVSLTQVGVGDNQVANGSFVVDDTTWKVSCLDAGLCTKSYVPIPALLAEYGEYTLDLTLVSGERSAEPVTVQLQHAACP